MAPQTRVVLVALVAGMLLALPFQVSAGFKERKTQISKIENTIAGLSTTVEVESKRKNQTVAVNVNGENGEQHQLKVTTDSERQASAAIPGEWLEEAGEYQVYLNTDSEHVSPLTVFPAAVSEQNSRISLKSDELGLSEMGEIRVQLTDEFGNPIEGHVLEIDSDSASVSHYSPEFATDENGEMTFYFSSKKGGEAELQVIDKTANKNIGSAQTVEFSRLHLSEEDDSVALATSDSVAELKISGMPSSVEVGQAVSFSISALDENEVVTADYTGTVEFESSDSRADLPEDYEFTEDDVGEHRFNLSVRFATPGKQSITVRDVDQPDLETTVEVNVKLEQDSDVDLGNDFETVDFNRDGDFTLVSPATGKYSENDIEVQGEADYGFDVILYVDDKEAGRTEVEFDNTFKYTLENLKDGVYDIRAEVVELGDGNPGEEEIKQVIEVSETEEVTVDTTAPDLKDLQIDPDSDLKAGESVEITVLSESNLETVSVVMDEEVFDLNETRTDGKYTADIKLPNKAGSYEIDIILTDDLGNEAEYRNETTLEIGESDSSDAKTDTNTESSGADAPTGIVALGGDQKVTLSWDPSENNDIDFYRIYYGPSAEALHAVTETDDSATSWTIPDLQANEPLYFVLVPVLKDGSEGKYSQIVMGVPKGSSSVEKPGAEETPAYNGENTPTEVPDAGAPLNILLGLSAVAAGFITKRSLKSEQISC